VILLDHNVPAHQVEILRKLRLRPQQIGREVGRPEWQDLEEILRYLHRQKLATFVTRDEGFFRRRLCHNNYCIVVVSGPVIETASYVRRFLRHPMFRVKQQRTGKIVRLLPTNILWWKVGLESRQHLSWGFDSRRKGRSLPEVAF
jgi:hypothetical protein